MPIKTTIAMLGMINIDQTLQNVQSDLGYKITKFMYGLFCETFLPNHATRRVLQCICQNGVYTCDSLQKRDIFRKKKNGEIPAFLSFSCHKSIPPPHPQLLALPLFSAELDIAVKLFTETLCAFVHEHQPMIENHSNIRYLINCHDIMRELVLLAFV